MASFVTSVIDRLEHTISHTEDVPLKIGLRTIWVLLFLRKAEIEAELSMYEDYVKWKASSLLLLFFRIERLADVKEFRSEKLMLSEVNSLGKAVNDELWMTNSSLLTVKEILGIAFSVMESARDAHKLGFGAIDVLGAIDALEAHALNLGNFLWFAATTGVELDNWMFHMKLILINAARVFIKVHAKSGGHLKLKCLAVCQMASDPQVYQAYSQALASSMLLATPSSQDAPTLYVDHTVLKLFLDSLVSILWNKLCQSHSDSRYKPHLKSLYERIRSTRTIVRNYKDEKTMGQIGRMICEAGVFIYSHHSHDQTNSVLLPDFLQRFDVFLAQVQLQTTSIKAELELVFGIFPNMEICDDVDRNKFDSPSPIWVNEPPQSSNSPVVGQVVDFHLDEVTSILDRLIRGSKQLRIVQISGMVGVGKTTFALQLFSHSHVMNYFRVRAWSPISQVFNKKKVLLQLLNQIHESPGSYSNMPVEDLANKLRKSLKERKYLILLDDVWTTKVWKSLEASFPNDSNGSRIIMTSRSLDIASCAPLDERPYVLRLREDDECLMILEEKLKLKEGWNLDIGKRIAKMCKGLPLTLGIVAGVLATKEQEAWNGILDQLGSSGVPGAERALELSYEQLPDYLQPCLLYIGAFPEDDVISVTCLIQLWMAEGFVRGNDQRIEDVARGYMKELIERSLVMVVESRSIGGVKKCRIHDLIHEFCRIKAKREGFFHLLVESRDELSDFNEPCNLQRLSIHSSAHHFRESKLFCPGARSILYFKSRDELSDFNEPCNLQRLSIHSSALHFRELKLFCPGARSILFFPTERPFLLDVLFITQVFQLLSVLNISQVLLGIGIPNDIDSLKRLRFLSITSTEPVIPSSIGNLPNLETFVVRFYFHLSRVSFPQTLWNLGKLKCLHFYSHGTDGRKDLILPTENLENSSNLLELESLRHAAFYCDDDLIEKQMKKFPNLRRLKCTILPSVQSTEVSHKIVVPEFPSQLKILTISGSYEVKYVFGSYPGSLRKLKMYEFELSNEDIEVIGKLPNLEVLKLYSIHFQENILSMENEGFLKLRILELDDTNTTLERWTASDYQLPCLVKMVFRNCLKLKEIPSCLEMSSTLKEIEVHNCSSTLEGLVRDVEEEQADYNPIQVRIIF